MTVTRVSLEVDISKMAASRRVNRAIKRGWLVNTESRRGYPANLMSGEPLPMRTGLPEPESLKECNGVTSETEGNAPPPTGTVFEEVF